MIEYRRGNVHIWKEGETLVMAVYDKGFAPDKEGHNSCYTARCEPPYEDLEKKTRSLIEHATQGLPYHLMLGPRVVLNDLDMPSLAEPDPTFVGDYR